VRNERARVKKHTRAFGKVSKRKTTGFFPEGQEELSILQGKKSEDYRRGGLENTQLRPETWEKGRKKKGSHGKCALRGLTPQR